MRIFTLIALIFTNSMLADMHSELNNFFDRFGSQSNLSTSGIYEGQKAGYLTGGGLTIRNSVMNRSPLTINLPKFDAGCGGIDLYAGGFSFINSQQLVDTLKSVGSSAMGYAFLLGLETVSPQVSSTIKNLQTWSNNINAFNINSCELAAGLVGSVWPRKTQASQHICRTVGGKKGMFNDYLSARHDCSQSSEHEHLRKNISGDPEYKDLLFEEYNLTWRVIQKEAYLANDQELAELFMTLIGTVVLSKEDKETRFRRMSSKIQDETFLKTLLEGGELNVYGCGRKKDCLVLHENKIHLTPEKSWTGKIQKELLKMQEKILSDVELSENEKDLLNKSNLPLYKIINVLTAYRHGYCPIDLYQISEIVAMDLLSKFLKEAIQLVREGCYQLKQSQMYSDQIDDFLVDLERVEKTVHYYETRSARLMEQEFQLMQKVQLLEQQIASEIILG
ncbi:MAG: hypothetical protein S4CHLAM123_07990 [Chlamydiales bacterium]|nr:hypothetical protein [Chlamydiales bacterium]